MKGFHNHYIVANYVRSIKRGSVRGSLYSLGSFPAYKEEGNYEISGQIFEFDDNDKQRVLSLLDALEGHPYFYQRKEKVIKNENNQTLAYVYVYRGKKLMNHLVESGSWSSYCNRQRRGWYLIEGILIGVLITLLTQYVTVKFLLPIFFPQTENFVLSDEVSNMFCQKGESKEVMGFQPEKRDKDWCYQIIQ